VWPLHPIATDLAEPDVAVLDTPGALDRWYGATRPAPAGRPWVGIGMIAALDGSTAVEGRSGGLGNDGDRAVFAALRRAADVIVVGAATVAAEGYGVPTRKDLRIGVVTASGRVDVDTELFRSGTGFLVMPEDGPPSPPRVDTVRAGRGALDLAVAVSRLGEVTEQPRFVLAEGGPTLNGALLDAGCVDELDLTIAPFLVGGASKRLVHGARPVPIGFELVHVLTDGDGYLFTRWVRAAA
jgi:riboflavin biosynthesis pyrimidine reductase